MPDGLYEHDALAWAEQQADLLRRLAAGERVNAAVDWPNVIEEVQDVGLSELRACRSLLRQALLHLLKLHAWPGSAAAAHWRDEAGVFLTDAEDRYVMHLVAAIPHRLEGLKIVLDCAHGAASGPSPDAFRDAGAELVVIGAQPDGHLRGVEAHHSAADHEYAAREYPGNAP